MKKIKRLAPEYCPNCHAPHTLYVADDEHITCRLCGYKMPEDVSHLVPTPEARPARKYAVTYGVIHQGEIEPWARSAYDTGLSLVQRDDIPEAIKAFERAIDTQYDFVDAHLWLGRLVDDSAKKLHHFSEVVAYIPNHLEAIRELMVLKGELTREEADRSWHSDDPNIQVVNVPVEADAVVLSCPVCGGDMRTRADGRAECKSCGYVANAPKDKGYGMKMLTMEVLKRRGNPIQWQVGERYLKCDSCGAETILKTEMLTARCPFCGSNHVVETDALHSFVEPDGVVPFSIDDATARTKLQVALNSPMEKVVGWFVNNKVADVRITSVYLPFWLYDMTLTISRTTQDFRSGFYDDQDVSRAYRHENLTNSVFDEPVCGVLSPSRKLTDRLDRYKLDGILSYDPSLLASHTAQLYTEDFEKGSLLARQHVSERMRAEYGHGTSNNVHTTVQSLVQTMQFRLVLLPVWVATLTEADGDVRLGLIHGQNGKVVLGEAVKRKDKQ